MVLLLAVALLAGISGGILSAAVWARDTIRAQDDQAAAHTATTYANPVDCTAADLDVTFTSPDSVTAGSGMTLNVTVNNTADEACLLDLGGEHIGALITSGNQTIWESTVCPFTPTSRRLLVSPGTAAAATIIWDGNVASSDCVPAASASASASAAEEATASPTAAEHTEEGEAAQGDEGTEAASAGEAAPAAASGNAATAGTYRVRIRLDGTDLTEDRVFVIE
ncbi:hypothetical protein [Actinomyces ruminis]|uniref:DUF4232 domain-containing protein n=1 Tax=Actinomyces ruminis TaxID=1937003 RepID=A0ABX4MBQ7_9ACTO|nr:hypothetical protein [Actinomyces ruminis]PHP52902.1 hypothetical protein BW737_006495 [Actinomyces ruminis]